MKTVQERVEAAVIEFCKDREPGMDCVKELSKQITIALLPRVTKEIYNSLTNSPLSAREIAFEVDMPINTVITSLYALEKKTTGIIAFSQAGRYKKWYKI